jgi:hypothetical protein
MKPCWLIGLTALMLWASPLGATVVAELTLDKAVHLSDQVVVGEVLGSKVLQDARGVVYTEWVLRVETCLSGCSDRESRRIIRMPGGLVPGFGCHVEGVPGFDRGERVLVLLDQGPNGTFRSVGLFQGVYSLVTTPEGVIAEQKPSGGALVVEQTQGEPLPRRLPYWSLVDRIRRAEVMP